MAYQTPQLTLHGSATGLVLGSQFNPTLTFGDHKDVGSRRQGWSRSTPEI